MLKQLPIVLGGFALCAAVVHCGGDDDDDTTNTNPTGTGVDTGTGSGTGTGTGTANTDPVIDSLTASRTTVIPNGDSEITVVASDADGDTLEYVWSATSGNLSATTGAGPVTWTAGPDRGAATITVAVSDGNSGSAQSTVDITVKGMVAVTDPGIPTNFPFADVDFLSASEGWAVGGGSSPNIPYIFHYKNGTWTDETVDTQGHLEGVAAISENNVWTSGSWGLLYHWNGTIWETSQISGGCVHGISFLNENDGWVTAAHGQTGMRHYTGGAINSWVTEQTGTNSGIEDVSMTSANSGWAVGANGVMLQWNGTAWGVYSGPGVGTLYGVDMISENDGWIVGSAGKAYHYDGTDWTAMDTGYSGTLMDVDAIDAQTVWAVGTAGTVLFYDGTTWTTVETPTTASLNSLDMLDGNEGWVVGANGTILHFE